MRKKLTYLLMAATLVMAVGAGKPMLSGAAGPIDLTRECSLTVFPENPKTSAFGEDLEKAKVVIDVYQVAEAEKTPGYDVYSYKLLDDYKDLSIPDKPSAADWQRLAQEAAKKTLDGEKTPQVLGKAAEKIHLSSGGLYLLIARGEALTDAEAYRIDVKDQDGNLTGDIATIANSNGYQYRFPPQLISLPMRGDGEVAGGLNEEGQPVPGEYWTSADAGPWVYDLNVYLKPEREQRFGSLEIVKDLLSHETEEGEIPEKVTFVFEVEGRIDGELVYSQVDSITFTAAGQERVVLERIPAMAQVTVTEVYTGSSYQVTSAATQSTTIQAADVVSVNFENSYDGHRRNGHGIKNQFTYRGTGGGADGQTDDYVPDGSWEWTQDPVRGAGEDNR